MRQDEGRSTSDATGLGGLTTRLCIIGGGNIDPTSIFAENPS
jgi:hypothetical protein